MGIVKTIRMLRKLEKDHTLEDTEFKLKRLRTSVNTLQRRAADLGTTFYNLENEAGAAKQRLGAIANATVLKSMDAAHIDPNAKYHVSFETTYRVIAAGCSPFLVGPAGSGKSTILAQVATAMNIPFYPMSVNALTSDYNIIGYNDANGKYIPTCFRMAYENGGLFSFEEIDAGNPNVLTVINNAMSQNTYMFPDKMVQKHPKFILAASGNTYGTGANIQYIGRNPLDAATLDRFATVRTEYDYELEQALCQNKEWLSYVVKVRNAINQYNMKIIAGTRAVLNGEKLLNAGLPRDVVEQMVLFKGAPLADIEKIRERVK